MLTVSGTTTLAADLRVVLGQLTRRLREQASVGDLTRTQQSVLGRLEREGATTLAALARAEGVRSQSMSTIVAALEEAGFVERAPDPHDGRKSLISVTEDARQQFATGRLAREDWLLRAIRTQLTAEEQQQLHGCVDLLQRLTHFA